MNEIINELRDQLAKLTEDNRILQIKLDDAVSEIDEMEHKDGKMIASLVNTLKNYESMVLQSFDSGSAQMICNAEKLIGELTYERDELCDKLQSESDRLSQKLRAAQHEVEKTESALKRVTDYAIGLERYSNQLKSEHDALAATVEALREVANHYQFKIVASDNAMDEIVARLGNTPQQHLRDVRAEAGRDGFIEGAQSMKLAFQYSGTYSTQSKADQYAERVKDGV